MRTTCRWSTLASLGALVLLARDAAAQAVPPAPGGTPPAAATPAPKPTKGPTADGKGEGLSPSEAKLAAFFAPKGGLTSDEVARRAEETSFQVKAKQLSTEAASWKEDGTKANFLPKVTGTARYTRLSEVTPPQVFPPGNLVVNPTPLDGPRPVTAADLNQSLLVPLGNVNFTPAIFNNYLLQAQVVVPVSDYFLRMSKAVGAAAKSKRAAQWDEKATRLQVAADARLAYYQWIRALGTQIVVEQALEQAKGHRVDAGHAFDVGMASKADVLRAESSVKGVELMVERAKNGVLLAEDQIRVLMHDTSGRPYAVGENILEAPPDMPGAASLEQLQAKAFERRLEVKMLDETEYALRDAEGLANVAGYPRVDVVGNAIYANPNQRIFPLKEEFRATWDASVVLTWTPTDIVGARASARENSARAAELSSKREALRDGLRLEVRQAYQSMNEAKVAMETSHSALVAAEESYRVRRDLYRNGRATSVELTDAETELTRARLEAMNARIDARMARVRLMHAVGADVQDETR